MATLSLKLKDELYDEIKASSKTLGMNTSAFVRQSIEKSLEAFRQQEAEKSLIRAGNYLANHSVSDEVEAWLDTGSELEDEPKWWREDD